MIPNNATDPGSFRDPSGFIYVREGVLFRQVNEAYRRNFDHLMSSGLYHKLVKDNLLVAHEEVDLSCAAETDRCYKVIKPQKVPFISYPYEWCFGQLKDAALATLNIQKTALEYGMSLKDCSSYNIQFLKGRPIFIDTLSFEEYEEGCPWVAYRQFCQHFLAPLSLMAYKDVRLSHLLRIYLDGIPLDLVSALLPMKALLNLALLTHLHLHAKSQRYYAGRKIELGKRKIGRRAFLGLIDSLESAIKRLKWQPKGTEWADYYQSTNYSGAGINHKKTLVSEYLDEARPRTVWDLGANNGLFSRIASAKGINTLSFDFDPAAVEMNYREVTNRKEQNILPLWIDLTNPSPGLGWSNNERIPLFERGSADTVMALALLHHLAIGNNLPFDKIAQCFHQICNTLIIEFVPKSDSQVQRLLVSRKDTFGDYNQETFETQFNKYFEVRRCQSIQGSQRLLFLMIKRGPFQGKRQ